MIYFAFGSNMDPTQMKARCPSHRVLGRAFLSDHELCFPRRSPNRKCGTAGIRPAEGKGVWGVLYALDALDLARLHEAEGYSPNRPATKNRHDFVRIELRRDNSGGESISAYTYIARPDGSEAVPSPNYMKHLIEGAEFHALPGSYVSQLRAVETG